MGFSAPPFQIHVWFNHDRFFSQDQHSRAFFQPMTSKKYRPSATPEPDALQEAFDLLPKTKAPGKLVVYKHLNFKQAPVWPDVAPYRHTLLKILDVTGGLNVTQVAGAIAMMKYVEDEGIAVGDSEPSEAIYRIRAMLSQIAYQKYRGRSIPRKWHQKFWLIYEKLMVTAEQVPPAILPMAFY